MTKKHIRRITRTKKKGIVSKIKSGEMQSEIFLPSREFLEPVGTEQATKLIDTEDGILRADTSPQ